MVWVSWSGNYDLISFLEFTWSKESYEQFDTAVNNSIIQMKDLKCCWHNILPTRMYEMAMCTLAQAFCQAVLQRIFADTKLISEDLVYMLAVRLQDAVEDITALFEVSLYFDAI